MKLLNGIGYRDDIDDVGNGGLGCVGEVLENELGMGLWRMEGVVGERM
ncbi:hypothetical protein [Staphylococcus epidermidis]|nr:hypothetical protein [Staphylococcus epidermidis]